MEIRIEMVPSHRIAYVRQTGPYGPANAQAMHAIKQWAAAKNLFSNSSFIVGISHDNPELTPPEQCRYDACIVIPDHYPIDGSVEEGELIGGKYATAKVKHTAEDIHHAWGEIFPILLSSGYQIDARPAYERYIEEMLLEHFCEICVPVK